VDGTAIRRLYSGRFFISMDNFRRYNFHVPTPFFHLKLAQELLKHPDLPGRIRDYLQAARCEFLFGNTAPDVQVVSGQTRQNTHFFRIPIQPGDQPAWEVLLEHHPDLATAERFSIPQAAFISGYLCHLQADWLWIKYIYAPVFGPGCTWGTFYDRLYYHNVLRAYLDQNILPGLGAGMDVCLYRVSVDGWLPFVDSYYLDEWRDFLGAQLQPGAHTRTVEVFSSRQGISAPEYYALLGSQERMQREVFEHVSLAQVDYYQQSVLEDNVSFLSNYLAFALHPRCAASKVIPSQGTHL
jgi:hypothetical protein